MAVILITLGVRERIMQPGHMKPESESASLMEALVASVRGMKLEAANSLLPQMGWLDHDARRVVIEAAVMSSSPDVLFWAVGKGFDPLADQELAKNSLLMAACHGCSKSVAWILEQAGAGLTDRNSAP